MFDSYTNPPLLAQRSCLRTERKQALYASEDIKVSNTMRFVKNHDKKIDGVRTQITLKIKQVNLL